MEQKILFLGLDKLYSQSKSSDYYKARFILDKSAYNIFISKETYEKLNIMKLKEMQEYIGVFKPYSFKNGATLNLDLIGIK